jgi:hypothetical protein
MMVRDNFGDLDVDNRIILGCMETEGFEYIDLHQRKTRDYDTLIS